MDQKKLEYFGRLLQDQLDELIDEALKTVNGMTNSKDTFPDPTDRAALETDRNFLLRIRDRERKLIEKIKEALDRIDNGRFGVCEVCGKDIGDERLMARPVTTLCIQCKKEQQARERARGL